MLRWRLVGRSDVTQEASETWIQLTVELQHVTHVQEHYLRTSSAIIDANGQQMMLKMMRMHYKTSPVA